MVNENSQVTEARYYKGWIPIPDTVWKVETVINDKFVKVGTVTIKGSLVGAEMDAHQSIKGYEPYDIAEKVAHRKYPKANPIIVSEIYPKRARKNGKAQHKRA